MADCQRSDMLWKTLGGEAGPPRGLGGTSWSPGQAELTSYKQVQAAIYFMKYSRVGKPGYGIINDLPLFLLYN